MAKPTKNYDESIHVSASQEACFQALATQMDKWWTQSTEGSLVKVGDTVTVRFPPDYGFWTFEAIALEGPHRIEVLCIDAHHKVDGQPKEIDQEWLGTRIIWNIKPAGEKTEVRMIHDGLTPSLKCWEICLDGWSHFFKGSLQAFLNGGDPTPHSAT